jgi:glycosyltransferase involved in cell wall biosynthesis
MRDTDEDKARFPHKISEYCASGRPIIVNKVGEINNYFDNTNAYLCSGYDEQEFADAMQKIISEPEQANIIARKSYETGYVVFNYKTYSNSLISLFIEK